MGTNQYFLIRIQEVMWTLLQLITYLQGYKYTLSVHFFYINKTYGESSQ